MPLLGFGKVLWPELRSSGHFTKKVSEERKKHNSKKRTYLSDLPLARLLSVACVFSRSMFDKLDANQLLSMLILYRNNFQNRCPHFLVTSTTAYLVVRWYEEKWKVRVLRKTLFWANEKFEPPKSPVLTSLLLSAMIMETPDWFSDVNRFFRMIQNW